MLTSAFLWIITLTLLAMVIDRLFGEPEAIYRYISHPIIIMGKSLIWLEQKFYPTSVTSSTSPFQLYIRGALATLLFISFWGGCGFWLQKILSTQNNIIELLLLALISSIFLASKSLFDHVHNIYLPLAKGDIINARKELSKIVGRKTDNLDESAITRAAIESASENFADGVFAPCFYLLLFGLPGIIIYKAINTADSMIGYRSERYRQFGCFAARLDDIANFIPARLCALLMLLCKYPLSLSHFKKLPSIAQKHRSINAGWPEGAMALQLDLALAGPREYQGYHVNDPFIHEKGRKTAIAIDILSALKIIKNLWGFLFISLLMLLILTSILG